MLKPTNQWPDTDISKNILFCSQLMRELLDPNSFETYRVFSLDTLSRIQECILLYEDYRKSRVPIKALINPFSEACWSVQIDPVIEKILSKESIETLSIELSNTNSLSKPYRASIYLRNKLVPIYKNNLEENILDCLTQTNRRNVLRKLISYYCSHLINIGYSRDFISTSVSRIFFERDHTRTSKGKMNQFFKLFPNMMNDYYVYCEVSRDFDTLLSGIGFEVKRVNQRLSHHDSSVKSKLPISSEKSYALIDANAMDDRAALTDANETLSRVKALSFLHPEASDVNWGKRFYVVKKRQRRQGDVFDLPESPLDWLSPQTTSSPSILNDIRRYSNRILENFDSNSIQRILKSVSTASSARYAPNVESQLIALWSSVEGLLSEPLENTSRIQHFSSLMLPCICDRHLHRRAVYLYEQLYASYKNKFRNIIFDERDFPQAHHHNRFKAILMFEENKPLRDKLLQVISENPLALNRLYQFYEDCKTPKKIHAAIESHEKRVEWQLSRIYRVRNSLVHKAERPGYLDSVVLNMFEYYIRMLSCIVRAASKSDIQSDLDQIVSEIYLDSISLKRCLKERSSSPKKNVIDKEIFSILNSWKM